MGAQCYCRALAYFVVVAFCLVPLIWHIRANSLWFKQPKMLLICCLLVVTTLPGVAIVVGSKPSGCWHCDCFHTSSSNYKGGNCLLFWLIYCCGDVLCRAVTLHILPVFLDAYCVACVFLCHPCCACFSVPSSALKLRSMQDWLLMETAIVWCYIWSWNWCIMSDGDTLPVSCLLFLYHFAIDILVHCSTTKLLPHMNMSESFLGIKSWVATHWTVLNMATMHFTAEISGFALGGQLVLVLLSACEFVGSCHCHCSCFCQCCHWDPFLPCFLEHKGLVSNFVLPVCQYTSKSSNFFYCC